MKNKLYQKPVSEFCSCQAGDIITASPNPDPILSDKDWIF